MNGNAAAPKIATRAKLAQKKGKRKGPKKTTKPSRLNTEMGQGIYIPPSRVKRFLDSLGLNKRIEDAINELREAEPHDVEEVAYVKNEETGKMKKNVTGTHRTELVPLTKLSEETRKMIEEARAADQKREADQDKADAERKAREAKMSAEELVVLERKRAETAAKEAAKAAERAAKKAKLDEDIKSGKVDPKRHPVRGQKKTTKYGNEIELLSKMRIRFSKDSSQQLASTICTAVHQYTRFAIQNCLKHELAIVKVRHAIEKGHDQLPYSCFFRILSGYRKAQADEDQRVIDEAKAKEEKKAAKKAAKEAEKAGEPVPAPVAAPVEPAPTDDEDDDDASFGHYVRQVAHNVMNEELKTWTPKGPKDKHAYETIRISAEFRDWMSSLVVEFINRFWPLLNGQIRTNGIKTVCRSTIRLVVNFFLESNGVNADESNKLFDEKYDQYQAYSKLQSEKKKEKKAAQEAAAKAAKAAGEPIPEESESDDEDAEGEESEGESEGEEEAPAPVAAPPAPRRKKGAQ